MAWLSVESLSKAYPGPAVALDDVSIAAGEGEFFAIVGPSNAGKSTLLKTIAGVERPDGGSIRLAGRDLAGLEPRERRLSLLFQNIALFPNRTGFENVAFPMRVAKRSETEIRGRVAEVASFLEVGHLLDRLPRTFSGGEQQRVAIARAIILPADLLMLDEPLTNLDARIRIALRLAFKKLHRDSGQSVLYVTHDQAEAMSMADRIGVLHEGRFVQIGTPDEIYSSPVNEFVARFIGSPPMNILDVALEGKGGLLVARGRDIEAQVSDAAALGERIPARAAVGVRPEEIHAAPERQPEAPFPGTVIWIERLGSHQILGVRLGGQLIKVRTRAGHAVDCEGPAWFGFAANAHRILDRATGLFAVACPHSRKGLKSKREETICA